MSFDFSDGQTGLGFQRDQLLLATDDVWLHATNGFGVFALAFGQGVGPLSSTSLPGN